MDINITMEHKIKRTDEEWKKELSPVEYEVLRNKATEKAFTGKYYKHHENGTYICAGCGAELFSSAAKYESGSGWPSFYQPVNDNMVATEIDESFGMKRVEIICANCGGHLGHVFDDGPEPTGLRYCVNSISLGFKKEG